MHRNVIARAALAGASLVLLVAQPAAAELGTPERLYEGLAIPWEVAPLPDGRLLVTERDENRVRVFEGGAPRSTPAYAAPGKVFGLALHPRFAENRFVYLFHRYGEDGSTRTRISRLVWDGTDLRFDRAIFSGIPSGDFHDGGRIVFGPDGRLYVTTGDQHQRDLPRDRQSLNGKILRLEAPGDDRDGTAPADNPFVTEGGNAAFVWSLGHRHPQGLAFDAAGRLWETEHGPSGEGHAPAGATCCRDELNLIVKGGDYGWPTVAGDQRADCTIPPAVHSGTETWAPGDLAVAGDGLLYAPALAGAHMHVFETSGDQVVRHGRLFDQRYGRLRVASPVDGALYFTSDGPSAQLFRAPVSPGAGTWERTVAAAAPPEVSCPAPAPAPPATATAPAPAPGAAGQPLLPPRTTTRVALDRVLGRTRTLLRRRGIRSLLRRGSVAPRAGGLPAGRVVLRASLVRRGRRSPTVAVGSVRVRDRGVVTVRLRITPSGRRELRRLRTARIVLRAAHVTSDRRRVARLVRVTMRR